MKKPLIVFVDDEPHNLTVMEAALPEEWEIKTFDNPLQALEALNKLEPCVILSDQRMPGITGVQFLELARKLHPHAVRIIVTGYSDEELVIESVRKAQVFDYIHKPWDPEELESSINKALDFYKVTIEKEELVNKLLEREKELQEKNTSLLEMTSDLEKARKSETAMREELECWVPPFVLWAIQQDEIKFPITKDIVGITFDIIKSSEIHSVKVSGKTLRSLVIQNFSEAIIRHGGWRESHSGDSAYGHFGLFEDHINPYEAALATAREFRVSLRSVAQVNNVDVECGIALHLAKDSVVDIHTVQLNTPNGNVTQKSFDTTSSDIDLLHRMEKLAHQLPGSNILASKEFMKQIKAVPHNIVKLGAYHFSGQEEPTELYLMPSDMISAEALEEFKKQFDRTGIDEDKVPQSGSGQKKAA